MARLLQRLQEQGWHGAITGPHGSGKSTLLAHLAGELQRQGMLVERHAQAGCGSGTLRRGPAGRVLLIDGWEQLALWRRSWLRWRCRPHKLGLVVTSHRPTHLPVLLQTATTLPLARRVATQLAGPDFASMHDEVIRTSFARHGGNLREVLFDLYDLHERIDRFEPSSRGKRPLCKGQLPPSAQASTPVT